LEVSLASSDASAGRSNLEVSDRAAAAAVKPLCATVGAITRALPKPKRVTEKSSEKEEDKATPAAKKRVTEKSSEKASPAAKAVPAAKKKASPASKDAPAAEKKAVPAAKKKAAEKKAVPAAKKKQTAPASKDAPVIKHVFDKFLSPTLHCTMSRAHHRAYDAAQRAGMSLVDIKAVASKARLEAKDAWHAREATEEDVW
jgi:hypothetical protein